MLIHETIIKLKYKLFANRLSLSTGIKTGRVIWGCGGWRHYGGEAPVGTRDCQASCGRVCTGWISFCCHGP